MLKMWSNNTTVLSGLSIPSFNVVVVWYCAINPNATYTNEVIQMQFIKRLHRCRQKIS